MGEVNYWVYYLHIYKFVSVSVARVWSTTFKYTPGGCLRQGLCIVWELNQLVSWLGIYVCSWYIKFLYFWVFMNLLLVSIQLSCFCALRLHFHTCWHFYHITMTLQLNNGHIYITTWTRHSQWVWLVPISLILFDHPQLDPHHLFISWHN